MAGFAEYDQYDAVGLAELVAAGDVSASELLEEAISRAERVNGDLNSLVIEHFDRARELAAGPLPAGPFRGVPFLLKDLHLALEGTVTTNGSAMNQGKVAPHSSTLVQRYQEAGHFGPLMRG